MAIGKKHWTFTAGHIPFVSTGEEPEFTSRDQISILNTSDQEVEIKIQIYYDSRPPVTDHAVTVKPNRVRKIRFNDLVDPLPIPLDTPFAFELFSSGNVIVQFVRVSTQSKYCTGFICTPFSGSYE